MSRIHNTFPEEKLFQGAFPGFPGFFQKKDSFSRFSWCCMNPEDVLEAVIGAWRDLNVTHIDLSNVNHKFIARRQYIMVELRVTCQEKI